ncbi:hypothetical protein TYRP_023711, partial [Tyrophagus putrescentiae]
MEDNTIKNQIISCHIGNLVNGLKALSDNRSLAQSICNSSNNASNNTSTFSEIDQIEQDRAEAKRRLEVAVKKLCKKSAKAEQFAKLKEAIGQNGDIDPDFVPTVIYTLSTLKVLTAEMQFEMERTNKLPLVTIIEEDEEEFATTMLSLDLSPSTSVKTKPVQRPSSTAPHPKYITELLAKVGDCLSLLSSYELNVEGVFGRGAQSTVHQAWFKMANGSKGSTIALKVQMVTARNFQDVLTEVNFIGGETAVLRHPNILTASRCSLFKSHTSNFLRCHFYMALALEPMADGSLADYVYDHWPEPFVACLMFAVLNALSYIHAQFTTTSNQTNILSKMHRENHRLWQAFYLKEEQRRRQRTRNKISAIRYTAPEKARARLNGGNSKQESCPLPLITIYAQNLNFRLTQFKPVIGPPADVLLADPFMRSQHSQR